ncbi:MAG: hypothetical protein U9N84_11845 [Actinomycetota bacterium]|nr:hypothetical protein [Actinomycetota bacterium]
MKAPQPSRPNATPSFNHLRRGMNYRATTLYGTTVGEYLGMEADYGHRSILLRHEAGTESIAQSDVTSIQPVAA